MYPVHVELLAILSSNDDSSHSLPTTQIQPQSDIHSHENAVAVGPVVNTTQPSCGMDIVYLFIHYALYICSYSVKILQLPIICYSFIHCAVYIDVCNYSVKI